MTKLKAAAYAKGYTLTDLADLLGIKSSSYLSRVAKGIADKNDKQKLKLVEILGVNDVEDLVD